MNHINHKRDLYNLLDWLGEVGGVSRAIMFIMVSLAGGFAYHSSRIDMMLHFYSDKALFKEEYKGLIHPKSSHDHNSDHENENCQAHGHKYEHEHGSEHEGGEDESSNPNNHWDSEYDHHHWDDHPLPNFTGLKIAVVTRYFIWLMSKCKCGLNCLHQVPRLKQYTLQID